MRYGSVKVDGPNNFKRGRSLGINGQSWVKVDGDSTKSGRLKARSEVNSKAKKHFKGCPNLKYIKSAL